MMSAVSRSSSSRPRGGLGTAQARRSETDSSRRTCSMQARAGARGSVVSPGRLRQDLLIQRQIGNGPTKTAVLGLQVLQPLHLIRLQPTKLLAPAVLGDLRHSNR